MRPLSSWPVVLLSGLWLACTAWLRPLTLPDEGRYVGVALEMLHSGDWLTPTLDGLPYFHKPPLFYWITAASLRAFGIHEAAGRAAPLLGALLGAGALLLFLRRWAGTRIAQAALLVLVTQPFFFMAAQYANLDMLVAGCITAAVLAFAHATLSRHEGQPWRAALLAAYTAVALGVLAKGLIGVLLPALVIGSWCLTGGRARPREYLRAAHSGIRLSGGRAGSWTTLLWWPGPLLCLLLALPWFALMQWQHPGFLHYFVVVQHLQRFAQGGFNNVQPVWFYPVVMAVLTLPWFLWGGRALKRGYLARVRQSPLHRLMWIWLALVMIFFSIPRSKLVGYVLPALPPLAFLIADLALPAIDTARRGAGRWRASVATAALVCIAGSVVLGLRPSPSRELALALRQQHAAGEPVILLERYDFDLPFYSRLRAPLVVIDDWQDPALPRRDNWRKELSDAAGFAPAAGARVLLTHAELAGLLCSVPRSWVLASKEAAGRFELPARAEPIASTSRGALWRIDSETPATARALACPGTPANLAIR